MQNVHMKLIPKVLQKNKTILKYTSKQLYSTNTITNVVDNVSMH